MAVRDAVPLGSAGTTRWLDEVERRLGSGVGDQTLRQALARRESGTSWCATTCRYDAQVTPTLAVHESLAESGINRVANFGPATGSTIEQPDVTLDGHTRLPYPSVEIYDVGGTSAGRLVPQSRLVEVRGAAEDVPAALTALGGDRDAITSSDAAGRLDGLPLIQTDGMQRREVSVGRPAENYSPVLTETEQGRQHRRTLGYDVDATAPSTTRTWVAAWSTYGVVVRGGCGCHACGPDRATDRSPRWTVIRPVAGSRERSAGAVVNGWS